MRPTKPAVEILKQFLLDGIEVLPDLEQPSLLIDEDLDFTPGQNATVLNGAIKVVDFQ